MVTLQRRTTHVGKFCGLVCCFHSFCHNIKSQPQAERDNRVNHGTRLPIMGYVSREGKIDLKRVNAKMFEVANSTNRGMALYPLSLGRPNRKGERAKQGP